MDPGLDRFLPFRDLRGYRPGDLPRDLGAAAAVTVLSVPQGVAYALIAGLPPAFGLFAAAAPAAVGSLMRSSRHVVAGPTNAVSLLVGGTLAAVAARRGRDPAEIALALAFLVGLLQLGAGLLRLGALVDYLSNPVMLGYVTGAATLIVLGQLPNLSGSPMAGRDVLERLGSWTEGLGGLHGPTLALGLSTTAALLALRRLDRRLPGPLLVMAGGIAASSLLDLGGMGVRTVADLAPIPAALPPLTVPDPGLLRALLPAAVAATVLSLVESSSVARSLAARTGDRLDADVDFAGLGLANLAAAFTSAYPLSGSLSRSMLNWQAGARTRLAGVLGGVGMLGAVLALGPVLGLTPIASLAGLLLVLAADLVDLDRIRVALRGGRGDGAAFGVTLVGTWVLDLDKAIYLGVAISVVLFLRRARLLTVSELGVDPDDRLREATPVGGPDEPDDEPREPAPGFRHCRAVRVLHVEGSLFFGAASELQATVDEAFSDPEVRVLVLRLKRCQGVDLTTAEVLTASAGRARREGRHLLLVGMRPGVVDRMEALGVPAALGAENLFPTEPGWFVALDRAIDRALELVGPHEAECPLERYRATRRAGMTV